MSSRKLFDEAKARETALAMRADGKTLREIAAAIGRTTVWLRQRGWLPNLTPEERSARNKKSATRRNAPLTPDEARGRRREYDHKRTVDRQKRRLANIQRWLSLARRSR